MTKLNQFKILAFGLIVLGIIFRLGLLFDNCSFNIDEAGTAIDICSRSFQQILAHDYVIFDIPIRPLGQLLIYKSFVNLLGNFEWVYRILPVICGIISISLFWKVVQHFCAPHSQIIALGLFSVSEYLIEYSVSIKQYSCDIMIALLIYLIFISLSKNELNIKKCRLYGFLGVLFIFFSYTSVFLLAALGLIQNLCRFPNKQRFSQENVWMVIYWVLGFLILYLKYFWYMTHSNTIVASNFSSFMPFSKESFYWIAKSFYHFMQNPIGLYFPILSLILFFSGMWVAYKKSRREFLMLFIPIVCVLLASAFKKYPFSERFLLFLVPTMIIFISQGIGLLTGYRNKFVRYLGLTLVVFLFYMPVKKAVAGLFSSECQLKGRELMQFFKENYRPGDEIYLNNNSQYLLWHYGNILGFNFKLCDHPIRNLNGEELCGKSVGIFDNNLWNDHGENFVAFGFEEFLYNEAGIFQTKFVDSDSKRFLSRDFMFSLPEGKKVWLLFLHSDPAMTDFTVRKFTSDATVINKMGEGGQVLFYLKRKDK